MKKLTLSILPLALIFLMSCGGGSGSGEAESADAGTEAESAMKAEGAETDLSEYGMDLTMVIPDGKGSETQIMANNFGGVDVVRGEGFRLTLAYGEGDIDMLKFDLEEDLMYKAEILEEGETYIMYKREIPDSGMDPEYHFMYVHGSGADIIEIQNMKDANFNEDQIKKMLAYAQSAKAKAGA